MEPKEKSSSGGCLVGIAAVVAAVLGTGGIAGLISHSPTPTPTPSVSVSPSPSVPTQKYCFGMNFKYYPDLTLPSQKSLNKYRGAAVILDFLADYPAISSGLLQGDAVVSVDGNPVLGENTLKEAGDYVTGGRPIEMHIVRPSKYSLTKSGSMTLFPPFSEYIYTVPVKLCPWHH